MGKSHKRGQMLQLAHTVACKLELLVATIQSPSACTCACYAVYVVQVALLGLQRDSMG